MKISVEEVNQVQRRVKVELTSSIVQSAFDLAYKKAQKKAHIKGFRPGKAPLNIIKKFYGQSVAMDVADILIRNHLFSALQEQSLNPISAPVLERMELPEEGKEYNFAAIVDIMPKIEINGYKGLKLSYAPEATGKDALSHEMEATRRQFAKMRDLPETTVCAKGHFVTINHNANKADGSDLPDLKTEDLTIEVGKDQVIKEVDEALVGMKAGDTKEINITLPQEYRDKDLAGQKITLNVEMKGVKELLIPAEDDEFAKDVGFESLAKLREHMEKSLAENAEQQKRNQLEEDLLNQLTEKNPFEVPPALVDQVIDATIDGMRFPSNTERGQAKKDNQFRSRFLEISKLKTKNTMILHHIIEAEKITVQDSELDDYLGKMLGAGEDGANAETLAKLKTAYATQARENLLLKKALDFVIEHAQVTEKPANKK